MATLACAIFVAAPAHAEGWLENGELGVTSGIEGGDAPGFLVWRRARTRVLGGVELKWDESATEGLGLRVFAEVEQRASLGGEVRYVWWPWPHFGAFAGGIFVLTPESLFGGTLGVRGLVPVARHTSFFLEPALAAYPLGTDLPDRSLVLWGTLSTGVTFGM